MTLHEKTLRSLQKTGYRDFAFIGAGAEARVWRASCPRTGRTVAVKQFAPRAGGSFYREMRLLCELRHAHLVAVHDFFDDLDGKILVVEYCSGGSLRNQLNQPHDIALNEVLTLGVQVSSAVKELHRRHFLHGDVKPENILRHRRTGPLSWKLGDFGICTDERTGTRVLASTREYAAPELKGGERTAASDIYSFGKMMRETLGRITDYDRFGARIVSSGAVELAGRMMSAEPARRPGAEQCHAEWQRLRDEALTSRYTTPLPDELEPLNFGL